MAWMTWTTLAVKRMLKQSDWEGSFNSEYKTYSYFLLGESITIASCYQKSVTVLTNSHKTMSNNGIKKTTDTNIVI